MDNVQNNEFNYDLLQMNVLENHIEELIKTMTTIESSINCCQSFDNLEELIMLRQEISQKYNKATDVYYLKYGNKK